MKATYGEIGGEAREIFKDPVTDGGTKKSAKGLLAVEETGDGYVLHDQLTRKEQEKLCCLQEVFVDGELVRDETLKEIRNRLTGVDYGLY